MAAVRCTVFTDPACPWSWAAEPALLRARQAFGDRVSWRFVLGGLAREVTDPHGLAEQWLEAATATGAPCDARLWLGPRPPRSTFPASLAVCAAREQGPAVEAAVLRRLREGFALRREPLDTRDALLAATRDVDGLDGTAFEHALGSSATVEAFGADVEAARRVPADVRGDAGRAPFPTLHVEGSRGERWVVDEQGSGSWLEAVEVCSGEQPEPPLPDVHQALTGHAHALTAPEVAALTGRALPVALAELWAGVAAWRARTVGGGPATVFARA